MTDTELEAAKAFLKTLRSKRRFKLLVDAADACIQNGLNDPQIVIWQAQGLIETGQPGAARISLSNLAANAPAGSGMFLEARGLLGRAWKQTFFDSKDRSSPEAQDAIRSSFFEYKAGFDAGSPWAGVNLLALSAFAKRNGIQLLADIDPRRTAVTVLGQLEAERHDNWYHGSRAEAYLATGDLKNVEIEIGKYVQDAATTAFELGSTLRQFTELWQLDKQGQQGHGIIEALRAGLLSREMGHVQLSPEQVRQSLTAKGPSKDQLQAILGSGGQAVYDWWSKGLVACAIGRRHQSRRGGSAGHRLSGPPSRPFSGERSRRQRRSHRHDQRARDLRTPDRYCHRLQRSEHHFRGRRQEPVV